jgi:hypothetical protein
MLSTGPALPAAAEDMTVEVRDSRGIPYMMARVMALNAGEALAKASSAHPDTEWVFLRELSRDEIAQLAQDNPYTAPDGAAGNPAACPAPAGHPPARTAEPSGTGALPCQLAPMP